MNNNIFFINNETPTYTPPGKGFGNLDISNNIRYGNSSRQNNNEYKEKLESKVSFEYQINYLNKQDDIPIKNNMFTKNTYTPLFINNDTFEGLNILDRVGETTRKQNQLNINRDFNNNIRDLNNNDYNKKEQFKFNYDN